MKVGFCSLCNEIQVLEQILKNSKLNSIVNIYVELLPLKSAFPTIVFIVVAAFPGRTI